jgi:hypothetical protein
MLTIIEEISKPKKRGAKPSFTPIDILRMIRIIDKYSLVSRIRISKELEIGEGTIRTIIRYLKHSHIIEVIRSGIKLGSKGKDIAKILNDTIIFEGFVDEKILEKLALAKFNYLMILRNLAHKIKKGIEERDIAIKYGTQALITLIFRQNSILFPDGYPLGEEFSRFKQFILKEFNLANNDVILISCSEKGNNAINGTYAVLYHLLSDFTLNQKN